jgi:glutamate racemase
MKNENPIGIFDSGIGGLNTLKILQNKLPNENFIYLADNINLPYGEKKSEEILKFSINIAKFFIEKNVKTILIPCNTSSSISYSEIKKLARNIEVFDIISPIVSSISCKEKEGVIAVIATNGTVKSNIYLEKFRFYNSKIKVLQIACPKLVSIIEDNLIDALETELILLEYLDEILKNPNIKTLIYGCTHYQHLDKKIRKILFDYHRDIKIFNPDDFLCEKVLILLKDHNLLNDLNEKQKVNFYVTGDKYQFFKSAKNFFDFMDLNKIYELKNFHN